MDFSASSIAANFIFGVVGMYLLRRAKIDSNWPWAVIALTLMVFGLFVSSQLVLWGTGLGLIGLAYVLR